MSIPELIGSALGIACFTLAVLVAVGMNRYEMRRRADQERDDREHISGMVEHAETEKFDIDNMNRETK